MHANLYIKHSGCKKLIYKCCKRNKIKYVLIKDNMKNTKIYVQDIYNMQLK